LTQFLFRTTNKILPLEFDTPPNDLSIGAEEIDDAKCNGTFPAARFANKADGFTSVSFERHTANRWNVSPTGFVRDAKIVHLQDRIVTSFVSDLRFHAQFEFPLYW
jgi:hypothetical protein